MSFVYWMMGAGVIRAMSDFLLRLIRGTTATGDGDTDPTVTRATTKVIQDHEGKLITIDSGEIAQNGARRVKNLMDDSDDLENTFTGELGCTLSGSVATFDGTANGDCFASHSVVDDGSGDGGRTFVYTCTLQLLTGTPSSNAALQIWLKGSAINDTSIDIGHSISTTAQRFSITTTSDAAGTTVQPSIRWDDAGTLDISEFQLEEVTGQFRQFPSEFVSVGVLSDPWHGAGVDGVKYFSTHNGQTESVVGAYIPGASGDDCTTPDAAAFDIAGSIECIVRVTPNDWTPAMEHGFMCKWAASGQRSYIFGLTEPSGYLRIYLNGSVNATSTVATGFTNDTTHWLRYTWNNTTDVANFYTAADESGIPSSWTQLGDADVSLVAASITNSTTELSVGAYNNGGAGRVTGTIHRAILYDGIGGTVVADFNPADAGSSSATTWLSSGAGAEQWTVNGNTELLGVVTDGTGADINSSNSQFSSTPLGAGNDGTFTTPDSVANSHSSDYTFIWHGSMADWTPATNANLINKYMATGNQRGYILRIGGAGESGALGKMGVSCSSTGTGASATLKTIYSSVVTGFADGTEHWLRWTWNNTTNDLDFYTSDDPVGTAIADVSWAQLGTTQTLNLTGIYDSNDPLRIATVGSTASAVTTRRAVGIDGTDPTATPAWDFNPNDWDAGKTWTSSGTNSEIWTINGNASVAGPKALWTDLDGTADGWTTPDSVATSITGDIFLACWAAVDDFQASSQYVIGKWETTGGNKSYCLALPSSGGLRILTSHNGSSSTLTDTTGDPGFIDGTVNGFAVSLDVSANTVKFWTTTDSPWTNPDQVTWVQFEGDKTLVTTGIADKAGLLVIGGLEDDASSAPVFGRIMRAYGIASTDSTVAPAWDFDPRNYQSGSTFTAATGEVWTIIGDSVIEGNNFPQMPWTAAGPNGLESEQAATNIMTYSNTLSNSIWTYNNGSRVYNAGVGSDGKKTMTRFDCGTTASEHKGVGYTGSLTIEADEDYCFSAEVKSDGVRYISLVWAEYGASNDNAAVLHDFYTGLRVDTRTEGEGTIVNSGMIPLPNGVYRVYATFNIGSVTGIYPWILASDTASPSYDTDGRCNYTGTAGEDFFVGRVQVEKGTYPTTYIETTSATATRNKDQLSYAGASNAAYPLTASLKYVPNQITEAGVLLDVNAGDSEDRVELSVTATGKPKVLVRSGGSNTASATAGDSLVLGVEAEITALIDEDYCQLLVDGVEAGVDDSLTLPADPTSINVGQDYNGDNQPNGLINDVNLSNEAITQSSDLVTLLGTALVRFTPSDIVGTFPVTEWTNSGTGGTGYDLDTVLGTAANLISLPSKAARLNGAGAATNDCFYTDHDAANTITGDLDLKFRVALDDWDPSQNMELMSKTLGTTSRTFHTYIDSSGQAVFFTKNNPTSHYTNSAVLGFADGTRHWLRITRESAGGKVNFYTAPDSDTVPTSWTQSGTADQTTHTGALIATNADLCVGNANVGWSTLAKGSFFRALLYKTIDSATPDVDFNPADATANDSTWTSSGAGGETWTISGEAFVNTTDYAGLYAKGGVGIETTAGTNIATPYTVIAAVKHIEDDPAANVYLHSHRSSATNLSYLYIAGGLSGNPWLIHQDGSALFGPDSTNDLFVISAQYNSDATSNMITDGGSATGDIGEGAFDFGSLFINSTGGQASEMVMWEYMVFNSELTDSEVGTIRNHLTSKYGINQ